MRILVARACSTLTWAPAVAGETADGQRPAATTMAVRSQVTVAAWYDGSITPSKQTPTADYAVDSLRWIRAFLLSAQPGVPFLCACFLDKRSDSERYAPRR